MVFWQTVNADLSRLGPVGIRPFLRQMFLPRGGTFQYVFWLRVVMWMRRIKVLKYTVHVIAYLIMRHYEFKFGIHANPNIYIGPGLHIVHGGCVFLNCERIGRNFTVYQGVTLGSGMGGGFLALKILLRSILAQLFMVLSDFMRAQSLVVIRLSQRMLLQA